MGLLKMLAYALLGYFIYELWQGMNSVEPERTSSRRPGRSRGGNQGGERRRGRESASARRAPDEDRGPRVNMTGAGRGTSVSTRDPSGATTHQVVGRGAVAG